MPSLRYAILRHDGIADPHFDLMFETYPGSALATWRSPVWPIESPVELTRLKDHRREYLQFEGEISGNRGNVSRVDDGACEVRVGENNVWQITFANNSRIRTLILSLKTGNTWMARTEL